MSAKCFLDQQENGAQIKKKMLKIPANMSKLLIEKMPHHAAVEKKLIFIQICKKKICLFISLGQVKL